LVKSDKKEHYNFHQLLKEKVQNVSFSAKSQGKSSKDFKKNNANHNGRNFTSNSKSNYNPNVTCHYCERKAHIVPDCKDKARNHANGMFKSQTNVVIQGLSTLASASSIETLQLFMVEENNCIDT